MMDIAIIATDLALYFKLVPPLILVITKMVAIDSTLALIGLNQPVEETLGLPWSKTYL